jgi:hypothetical protein
MGNITDGIVDFKNLEQIIFKTMCQTACEVMATCLGEWDKTIKACRDIKEYQVHSYKQSHINTVFGRVDYTRTYYRRESGGFALLLDEAMGIESGCGMTGENLAEMIVAECADKSFRKAAESISSQTGQTISRMYAWNVFQQYGGKLEAQVERLEELTEKEVTGQRGNIPSAVLFVEHDDVWINQQRGERRKKGEPSSERRKRVGKRPMHIGTAYTGWKQLGNGSYETMNKVAYASFGGVSSYASRFEALLQQFFDMDGVEHLLMNGDGADWIKTRAEESDAILQLDPFHRSRAIMRAVKDKGARKAINDALREKDVEKALDVIAGLIAHSSAEPELKKLADLLTYFDNNRGSLLPWQDRGLDVPAPPEGVVYRNMGLQEHYNCDLITQRMKHRKGSWSPEGGNKMASVLCFKNTVGLESMLRSLPEAPSGGAPNRDVLSAAKAPASDGKGDGGSWMLASLPIEGAFRTQGRAAVLGLTRQRPISDVTFAYGWWPR